jgi:hypothetical protein
MSNCHRVFAFVEKYGIPEMIPTNPEPVPPIDALAIVKVSL